MNQKIIDIARAEVGYTESPPNSNKTKYGAWFGYDGVPWCAIFVSWCYHYAGYSLGNIGFKKGFAGCQTAYQHFKETKEITRTPMMGDIVLLDWNGDGRFDHVEIFEKDLGNGFFQAVGGNTSAHNKSNGGEVHITIRKYSQAVFVHPKVLGKPAV